MKKKELERLVLAYGWYRVPGGKGSHSKYRHSDRPGVILIGGHGNHDIPTGTLKRTLKMLLRGK